MKLTEDKVIKRKLPRLIAHERQKLKEAFDLKVVEMKTQLEEELKEAQKAFILSNPLKNPT